MTTTTVTPTSGEISVLLVGHCNFDAPKLKALATQAGATRVDGVATAHDAFEQIGHRPYRLALVNRLFDLDSGSGIDFIKDAVKQFPKIRFMLISNLSDAQSAAENVGGAKGFGKDSLADPGTVEVIKKALAPVE